MKRRNRMFMALAVMTLSPAARVSAQDAFPSDAEIRRILTERIDTAHQGVGIVAGVIDTKGRRVITWGRLDQNDPRTLDGDTVFEIGSATKVFTSLLLADMVQRGEVVLTDPVAKYLPPGTKVPERGGHSITLLDLATHTSGLPRLPTNLSPADLNNPYADYSVKQMYQFLASYELTRDIGSAYEYSNFGAGLLGHALALRAGLSYEALVRARICDPLGMKSTAITLSPELKARLAVGHNAELKPVANWDLPTLAGAGALRSTANDLLTFVAANLGMMKSPLAPAMAEMLKVRRPTNAPGLEIALGWHVFPNGGNELVWHNGGTGGYRSFIGFSPKAHMGVVLLSNTMTAAGVDDIGFHLLDAHRPLIKMQKEITVGPKVLEGLVGRYQLAPNFILTVTREGDHLYTQATGQPRVEVFASSEKEYFLKVVDAQLTFETDAQGKATRLILHQNGMNTTANRIEGEVPVAKEHKQVAVDPKIFDGFVGRYQLAPSFIITVTREGDQLFLQATGQPKFEIFPEGERDYFLKVVDAQVTFDTDANGKATSLTLHQNGMNTPGKRI